MSDSLSRAAPQPPGRPERRGAGDGFARARNHPLGPWLGLLALCLALYLPGFFELPPFDRDEARFAQASRQMVESGDWVHIHFQQDPRNKKPIGIYWVQAAAAKLAGGADAPIWAYRLPSLVAAILATFATYAAGRRLFDPGAAFVGASLMAASLLLVGEAHLAKTDAAQLAAVAIGEGALAFLYLGDRRRRTALILWAALGAGILIKGPVMPLVLGLTGLALLATDWRSGRRPGWILATRPWLGVPLAAAIVLPWFLAIAGDGFVGQAVKGDMLPKLIGGQESHGAPPGIYLALIMATFFPGSLLLVPALRAAWRDRLDPSVRFCLCWILPSWVLFELVPTKLPHYVLPLYPALALLVGRLVTRPALVARLWYRIPALLWGLVALALAVAAIGAPWYLSGRFPAAPLVPALAGLVVAGAAFRQAWAGRGLAAAPWAVGAAALLSATLLESSLPWIDELWLSRSAAELVAEQGPRRGSVAAAGYAEPSLVFLLGTDTILADGIGAARALATGQASLAIVEADQGTAFAETARQLGITIEARGTRSGLNYSRGQMTALTLYRRP